MIRRRHIEIGTLLSFLGSALIAYNTTATLYFIMIAAALFFAAVFIRMKTSGTVGILAEFILLLALNNLCDELFFDPFTLGANELGFALIALFRLDYQLGRYARTH